MFLDILPLKNDAVVLGILMLILAFVFQTSSSKSPFWKKFYTFFPALLMCYFLPGLLNTIGIFNGEESNLYFVASRYLLPASLVLLCISIDFKGIIGLGPKALIMFGAATVGIVLGGPVAVFIVSQFAPGLLDVSTGEEAWRGLTTVAGSWIGGGANQAAMKEVYGVSEKFFSSMLVVDVIVANIWMGILLYGIGIKDRIDEKLKADNSAIKALQEKMENYSKKVAKVPTTKDLFVILGIAFGAVGFAHFFSDSTMEVMGPLEKTLEPIGLSFLCSGFFWLVVIATTIGVLLSFSPKIRSYEGAGASKIGSVCLYILVATIGMKMNLMEVWENLGFFSVGLIWMAIHVTILLVVAYWIKAPFFFVAVGSQANVGGAASAPIVASAFSPALAPVGVLLAVLGYALGTYGAILCAVLMEWVS